MGQEPSRRHARLICSMYACVLCGLGSGLPREARTVIGRFGVLDEHDSLEVDAFWNLFRMRGWDERLVGSQMRVPDASAGGQR